MKKCGYCQKPGSLTKEHIWPSNIIRKYEERLSSYNKRIDKFVYSDPIVKDVCATCNNVLLSKLDAYLSNLYDEHLYQRLNAGESTKISFNYNMLLRSLLKVSFNSSRAMASDDTKNIHGKFAKYILHGGYKTGVQLRLLVVTSSRVIADGKLLDDTFPVSQLRCADIPYDGILSHRFIIRLIAINSFWFYLIISKKSEKKHIWNKFIIGFKTWKIQPGIHLKESMKSLDIQVNQTTYMTPELMGSLFKTIQKMSNE